MVNLLQKKVVNPVFAESMDNLAEYQTSLKKNKYTEYWYY